MDTVYKVVQAAWQEDEIILTSSLAAMCGPFSLRYYPQRKVYPELEDSYLYAFDDKEAACAYITGAAELYKPVIQVQVWEARARVIATKPTQALFRIEDFWRENWHALEWNGVGQELLPTAEHTVWCEWIELVKKVKGLDPVKK